MVVQCTQGSRGQAPGDDQGEGRQGQKWWYSAHKALGGRLWEVISERVGRVRSGGTVHTWL